MLVLTRKKGQSIVINDNITIQIKEVGKDSVRIAIDAPDNISIYRSEIYDEIQEQNNKAIQNQEIDKDKFIQTLINEIQTN